jgi:carboxypeptidase family protein/TonB-dependent receptor-like protein
MEKHKVLRMVGLLVFLSGGITKAQVTTGTISGTVKDSSGAVLPGAKVVVLNEETGISRTVAADAAGRYSAMSLSLGNYRVTGTLEGFQTEVRIGILLTVGREAVVDLSLAVGAVTQTVEVKGEAPLVESTTASLGSLVDDRTIRALPLNGRSYDQLALLQPGVILTSPGIIAGSVFLYGTGKRFSVGGQRSGSNSFLLDGTDINDQANGTPGGAAGTNLGVDTIREFKIFTNSFKAEYGHSSGSVVTAVTRSGTNTLHGTAFEYIRNSALDARNFFDVTSSPPSFKRNQFGGVLGGPIKKDKTFIFGGYEGLRQGLGTTLIATVPTLLARQGILPTGTVQVNPASVPFLNLYPLPNGRDFGDGTGEFLSSPTIVTNEDNFMVRVDHQLNDKTGIFGRYTFDNDSLNNPLSIPPQVILLASRRQYTTLQANSILSPKALNNFRSAFNRTHSIADQLFIPDPGPQVDFIPGQLLGTLQIGAINNAGSRAITALGAANGQGAFAWAYNIFEWGDDFSYVTGKHSLKTGADIQRIQDNTKQTQQLRGTYTFTTFNDFLAGRPANLQASSPLGITPYWGLRQTLYAVYGQDDYTVNSRLTLNLGLRWETTTDPIAVNGQMAILPSPAATNTVISDRFFSIGKKNFEPRVGLAWRLNASGKTVLRAGGGIYHNQILPALYSSQASIPPFFGTLSATNPPFPNGYQILKPGAALINLKAMPPVDKVPVNDQYNVSLQQEIFRNTVVQVAYAGDHSNHLFGDREADTAIPTICPAAPCPAGLPGGTKYFPAGAPRLNPAWAGIRLYSFNSNSVYNSVTVTLRRQSSSGFVGQIFYTFSKAMDEGSNGTTSDSVRSPSALLDPANRARDWGLSEFDSRHAVVANFSYPVPFRAGSNALGAVVNGWTLDGIGTFTAGLPFTARLAAAVSRDLSTQFSERPDLKPGASQNPNSGTSAGCPGFPAGTKLGGPGNFYDPCSFSLPLAGTYGNLGRNTIIGPGVADVDLALEKNFKLREKVNVTFRAELFNIMNHANLGLPNTTPLAAGGAASPSAGRITYTTTSARQLQFALRINF